MNYIHTIIFIIGIITLLYHKCFDREIYNDLKAGGQKEKKYVDYINTSHSGMIRGLLLGAILGDAGIYSGIRNGAVFSVINPLMLYLNY